MFRKFTVILCAIFMLCATAYAEDGISGGGLPVLSSTDNGTLPMITETTALSFGVEMNVKPTDASMLPDGRWQEVYQPVTAQQYNEFAGQLGMWGYAAADAVQQGTLISAKLVKGAIAIEFSYDTAQQTVTMTYPVGVKTDTPEPPEEVFNPYIGYTRLNPGDTLKIPNFGSLVIGELHLGDPIAHYHAYNDTYGTNDDSWNVWFTGSFTNTTNFSQSLSLFLKSFAKLVYVTPDNTFTFDGFTGGKLITIGGKRGVLTKITTTFPTMSTGRQIFPSVASSGVMTSGVSVEPLETIDAAFGIANVPDAVAASDEGIVALIFGTGNEKYILYLREP